MHNFISRIQAKNPLSRGRTRFNWGLLIVIIYQNTSPVHSSHATWCRACSVTRRNVHCITWGRSISRPPIHNLFTHIHNAFLACKHTFSAAHLQHACSTRALRLTSTLWFSMLVIFQTGVWQISYSWDLGACLTFWRGSGWLACTESEIWQLRVWDAGV